MHLPDGDREVIACLKRLTEDAYESVKRAVLPLSFSCDRYSAYETMISTIANTSSFVMMVVCNAPGECAMTVLDHLLACCVAEKEGSDVVDVMRLLVVVYFAFSSAIHVRQCILQAKLSQQRFFLRHSQFLEDASRFLASVLARHTNTTLIAVFTNYLGEMMHSFVRKWKDLYRTTDVLMNGNVFSASDHKQQSIYGDNTSQSVFYCGNFCSYAFFKRLFEFLFAITKYNSYKNPSVYNGAVEYVSICIFERIFGIAFIQQFSDASAKNEVNWESLVSSSEKEGKKDWLGIGDLSIVELAYAVSDVIKGSGRNEFFKSAGKTRFVFLMVCVGGVCES